MPNVWAVLASGPSIKQADVDRVQRAREDKLIAGVAAVSNVGIDLAPWADCLISHDSCWWRAHPKSHKFAGEMVCSNWQPPGGIQYRGHDINGCNSGRMAMQYVWKKKEADKIILLGFDMHGTHYFGKHTDSRLRNTSPQRFSIHIMQFNDWRGPPVINCTPGSALKKFPFKPLEECLIDLAAEQV